MPSFTPNRSKAVPSHTPVEFPVSGGIPLPAMAVPEPATPAATVRETFVAVVDAIAALDRRADIQPNRVELRFHVAGEPIALRVELKDGTVHTLFQNVSDELRAALSREWQIIVPPAIAGHLRLADPVFHASTADTGTAAFAGSTGQGTLPQRGQPAPESVPGPGNAGKADTKLPQPIPAAVSAVPELSLLNAFA